ncbi:MAG: CRISPR-associated helicase Cas3' [Elusimicrobia bacterium]|nr:CRISPR-associated helicase Cas3' [Elusimicrobiota bacterium]
MQTTSIIHFWAKTTSEGKPGISVYDHMMNVGCVARCIAEATPGILERFHLQSSVVGALVALHDLGKISPGFQRKCEEWLKENGLLRVALIGCWDTTMEKAHAKVSHAVIQAFLLEKGIDRQTAKFVSAILGAHHGHLMRPNDRGYIPQGGISDPASQIDWDGERKKNARMIWDHFIQSPATIALSDDSPALWWLAGLTTIADWIGSDERFFLSEPKTENEKTSSIARNALNAIGFKQTKFIQNLSFHDLFHDSEKPEVRWVPNNMQVKAMAAISGHGVYVIEAPMGMGKTEAALWAAYNLLLSGKATGIYFALPTQATSNRIHQRVNKFLRRICAETTVSRLIHGNAWLMDTDMGIWPVATEKQGAITDDARTGRNWFASAKRALIAPFGVGTIDQALLGVVAAKHFFVRHFALAGKVVILDEVHSYDLYTGTLIDKLITTLEALGCTVIILSATLTKKRREQIVSCPKDNIEKIKLSRPLITGRKEGHPITTVAATPPKSRKIKIEFIDTEKATEEAIALAQNGGAVLWICNTIDSAQKQYRRFKELAHKEFPIGLLHSRFPFWRREQLENEWMKRFDKTGATRCGAILVSTQIVEQSVDLDADLMITELAPTDMLLQRMGRLWRHERKKRPVKVARLCIIKEGKSLKEFRNMKQVAIKKELGNKAYMYNPFVLLRSLEVWNGKSEVSIPLQIRQLIESTYEDRNTEPDAWQKLFDEWFGTDSAKKMLASRNCNLWQVALEDEEGVQTRLNDMPTVSVVLCRNINRKEVVFIDDTSQSIGGDFLLEAARAISKNLVRVPLHCFEQKQITPCSAFADYLYGKQTIGIVEDGIVKVEGLKNGTRLFYSNENGLEIEKLDAKEQL